MNKFYIYPLMLLSFLNSTGESASGSDTEETPLLAAHEGVRNRKRPQPFGTPLQRENKSFTQTQISPAPFQSVLDQDFEKIKDAYAKRKVIFKREKVENSLRKALHLDEQKFINLVQSVHGIKVETARSLYQQLKSQESDSFNIRPRFNRALSSQTDASISSVNRELTDEGLRKLLRNKSNVETVNLMNNCITNEGLKDIARCNKIKVLNLCGNEGIDYKGVMSMLSAIHKKPIIQGLITLHLSEVNFNEGQRDRLSRQCKIVSDKLSIHFK